MNIDMEKLRLQINDLLYCVKVVYKEDSFKDLQESLEIVFLAYLFPAFFKVTDYSHVQKIKFFIDCIDLFELQNNTMLRLENNSDELKKFLAIIEDEL